MSYALSVPLQEAVFARLSTDSALAALVGPAIFDATPPGPLPLTYIALGAEQVRDRSDVTGPGAEHDLTVSAVTREAGFLAAKRVAEAVEAALIRADLSLSRGSVVALHLARSRALRADKAGARRIDMIFRVRVTH